MSIDTTTRELSASVRQIVDAVSTRMPREKWPFWFDGWPHDAEAALLDAIFSARATYGSESTGVRKVVSAWRVFRGAGTDDLSSFAQVSPEELIDILGNRQRVSGNRTTKADAVQECAAALVSLGVRSVGDLWNLDAAAAGLAHSSCLSVPGVGPASWEVFIGTSGVVGAGGTSVDDRIRSFATAVCGRAVDFEECDCLIRDASELLEVTEATLRHSIWRYQRRVTG
ncbi:MAG: hypothetical protein WBF79_16570 [Rhodococcus sp. (in: high G+C Gram-positive bacteria)]